jgi:hypothetical protein
LFSTLLLTCHLTQTISLMPVTSFPLTSHQTQLLVTTSDLANTHPQHTLTNSTIFFVDILNLSIDSFHDQPLSSLKYAIHRDKGGPLSNSFLASYCPYF